MGDIPIIGSLFKVPTPPKPPPPPPVPPPPSDPSPSVANLPDAEAFALAQKKKKPLKSSLQIPLTKSGGTSGVNTGQ